MPQVGRVGKVGVPPRVQGRPRVDSQFQVTLTSAVRPGLNKQTNKNNDNNKEKVNN